jgi:hypothetical protein
MKYVAGHNLEEYERNQYVENRLQKELNFLNSHCKKQLISINQALIDKEFD